MLRVLVASLLVGCASAPVARVTADDVETWPGRGCLVGMGPDVRIAIDDDACVGASICRVQVASELGAVLTAIEWALRPDELEGCGESVAVRVDGVDRVADVRPIVRGPSGIAAAYTRLVAVRIGEPGCALPQPVELCPGTAAARIVDVSPAIRALVTGSCASPRCARVTSDALTDRRTSVAAA